MIDISTVPPAAVTGRLFTVFFLSFFIIFITARLVGSERKALWFKRRTNYTLLNRRGILVST